MSYQPAAREAADFINEQWSITAAALCAIVLGLEHPGLRESFKSAAVGEEQVPLQEVRFRRKDGTEHVEPFFGAMGLTLRRPRYWRDFTRASVMGMISLSDAVLAEHDRFDKAPVIEFIRHLRNGISHGNGFYLKKYQNGKQEPVRAAHFKGKAFEVTKAMDNDPVLFEYIDIGDVFDLFNEVQAHLRQLP